MRRLMLGMSQEKLGDALDLTFQQVQKYEKGTNRIGASRLQQISLILQVPVSFFFEGAPAPPGSGRRIRRSAISPMSPRRCSRPATGWRWRRPSCASRTASCAAASSIWSRKWRAGTPPDTAAAGGTPTAAHILTGRA